MWSYAHFTEFHIHQNCWSHSQKTSICQLGTFTKNLAHLHIINWLATKNLARLPIIKWLASAFDECAFQGKWQKIWWIFTEGSFGESKFQWNGYILKIIKSAGIQNRGCWVGSEYAFHCAMHTPPAPPTRETLAAHAKRQLPVSWIMWAFTRKQLLGCSWLLGSLWVYYSGFGTTAPRQPLGGK